MSEVKDVVQDIMDAAKRRRVLLIITPVLFVIAASVALHFIEPKYKSSTTILVEKDETLNPLVLYDMAVNLASEDRLKSLNEIIYSRSTMEILIDTLKIERQLTHQKTDKQQLISNLQKNIGISSRGSDSFEISFFSSDPYLARDGARFLANHFIKTKLRLETRRHEETVSFFSNKLTELESIVNQKRDMAEDITTTRLKNLPNNSEALQERLQTIGTQLETIEWKIINEEKNLNLVKKFQEQPDNTEGIKELFKLPLSEIQFGEELSSLLNEYENLQQQFTQNYPRLRTLLDKIKQVVNRIPPTIETNLQRLKLQRDELLRQKEEVINNMQLYFVSTQRASSQQSDFSIFESLYNEMKVKLEQAKMTRDINKGATDQFIVLDEAVVPEKASSPNKKLIVGIGLLLGLITGVLVSATAEVLDTTIRTEEDMPFDKPIIAYITEG